MQLEMVGPEPKSQAGKELYREILARPRRRVTRGAASGRILQLAKYRNGGYEWWPVSEAGEVDTTGRTLMLSVKEMRESVGVEA